jgi:Xaa-Pro aminopeptidase
MRKSQTLLALLAIAVLLQGVGVEAQEARARYETMKEIRREKLDLVLPGAMRDNNVDMWIHVMQDGFTDPLYLDLGVSVRMTILEDLETTCFVVFTDRGDEGIERAVFGAGRGDRELYSISGEEAELGPFVAERDPKRIAVNMSEQIPASNGLSYTGYLRLVKHIGEKYEKRLISAEDVITDFRVRRVQSEIVAFAKIAEIQRQLMEAAYRRIVPGVTTREELGWWVQDQLMEKGLLSSTVPRGPSAPGGRLSRRVYERGDFLSWDWGLRYLNFGTDYKRYAYILREGETDIPAGIKHAWDRGIQARGIIRKTIKVGYTAGEMLEMMVKALEDTGVYEYTPSDDYSSQYRDLTDALGESDISGFTIDCHCVGNTGNSEIAVGPSMAPFRPWRTDLKIQQNNLFAFEFVINTWNPDTQRRMSINFEDNSIVTEKGVEALYPRNDRIIVIP